MTEDEGTSGEIRAGKNSDAHYKHLAAFWVSLNHGHTDKVMMERRIVITN